MPLYQYQCRACGHDFETLVRGAEQPACPACQSHDIERLLSSFGVSSEARSHSTLQAARRDFTHSTDRIDRIRHEAEQVRDHVQEDYGLRGPKLRVSPDGSGIRGSGIGIRFSVLARAQPALRSAPVPADPHDPDLAPGPSFRLQPRDGCAT